jgi:hypothetical protein
MIVLRLPPFPIDIKYDVPQANTDYLFTIENSLININISETLTSDSNSQITFTLTGDLVKYDDDYSVQIYEADEESEQDLVLEDSLTIIRPYVNPNTLGTTATEIAEATYNERLARAIIDSIIGTKFTFEKKIIEVVGQGTDYLAFWEPVYSVNKVYENARLVYDITNTTDGPALDGYNYIFTKDGTSMVKVPVDYDPNESKDRLERKPLKYRDAGSDSFYAYAPYENYDNMWTNTRNQPAAFPEGVDYIVDYDAGYKVIPGDIRDAMNLLIEDIKCGRMEHYKTYISEYQTDQFRLKYDSSKFSGTGNILVDMIIDKYITDIKKPGLL